jgi:hypothetical protein
MDHVNENRPTNPDVQARRAHIEACMQSFRTAQGPHQDAWRLSQEVPRRLYHYTSLDGVVGIVSSSKIYASDARFMNDASELDYAAELISDVVESVSEEVTDEPLKHLLPRRRGFANSFEYGDRAFVACFCEQGDMLSQWKGYGRGDAPASLGFDLFYLPLLNRLPPRTYLRKVVYERAEQEDLVRKVVRTWIQAARALLATEGSSATALFPYPAIWALQEALSEHHLCFKNPAFREEREWRLIKLVNVREELSLLSDIKSEALDAEMREQMRAVGVEAALGPPVARHRNAEGINIQFRASPRGLVPYVELPLIQQAGVFHGRLPLYEVIQGPTPHPDLAMISLEMYLDGRGYGVHTKLRKTDIPLRPWAAN